ncbi:MAG: cell division protein ZapE [Azospirillum brasilense]|nr:MAG: cell division protein ZapE [Azospirillum brasilense]
MSQAEPSLFLQDYNQRIINGALKPDPAQQQAALALDALFDALRPAAVTGGLLARLRGSKRTPANGLYLWGDVGRGKSMLMDLFVAHAKPMTRTRRMHFHAFMLDVHKRLHAFRQLDATGDLMPRVIADIASEIRVLCLDELQVTDVTDALILARLFEGLMDAGVCVVFTSNRPPHQLYQHGLQREQFMKFVELLKRRMPIHELKSPTDYRLEQWRTLAHTYHVPLDATADDFLLESWQKFTQGQPSEPLNLEVQGRILRVDRHSHGVAWLTFDELCRRPLGANDYLTLGKVCHTLLLQGIPAMTKEDRNEAKRFVTLIDTLYDLRVKLIATAQVQPEALYPGGDGSFEFHRTVSRLHEMQSEQYLALAHLSA